MRRYGWFWECPNGENCHYRHALPPGFVLKSQKKALEDAEKANAISLEEFLEVEVRLPSMSAFLGDLDITFMKRHKLGSNLTPVTPESFAKWKRTRMDKKLAEEEALKKAKDEKHAAGKSSGMSGRDLVRLAVIFSISAMLTNIHLLSLHTTRSGSRTMTNPRKSGILPSTGRSRRTRILQRKKNVSANYSSVKADLLKLRQTMQTVAPSELHTSPTDTTSLHVTLSPMSNQQCYIYLHKHNRNQSSSSLA